MCCGGIPSDRQPEDIALPKTKRTIRAALEAVMPQEAEQIRIFNQATMELGPRSAFPTGRPGARNGPARRFCLGRIRGTALSLPVKSGKKERRREEKTVFLLVREGRLALRRRPDTGLLAGLWEFPNVEGALEEASGSGGGGGLGPDAAGMAAKADRAPHLHPCGVGDDRLRAASAGGRPGDFSLVVKSI